MYLSNLTLNDYTGLDSSTVNTLIGMARQYSDECVEWIEESLTTDARDMHKSKGVMSRTILRIYSLGGVVMDIQSGWQGEAGMHANHPRNKGRRWHRIEVEIQDTTGFVSLKSYNGHGGGHGVSAEIAGLLR